MAEKIGKTRPEILRQRRTLAKIQRFLPILQLKKRHIQTEILMVSKKIHKIQDEMHQRIVDIFPWSALFSESLPGTVIRMVKGVEVKRGSRKVAGVELPVLESVKFEINPYSRFSTPPWVDKGVEFVKIILEMRETARTLLEQLSILKNELRKITQRVNLFEKVLIPHCREAIRVIHIQLGEEQTAAVVQAKIAREKIAVSSR